jgi:hypothetical protein
VAKKNGAMCNIDQSNCKPKKLGKQLQTQKTWKAIANPKNLESNCKPKKLGKQFTQANHPVFLRNALQNLERD